MYVNVVNDWQIDSSACSYPLVPACAYLNPYSCMYPSCMLTPLDSWKGGGRACVGTSSNEGHEQA